jgi:hypothetical protein
MREYPDATLNEFCIAFANIDLKRLLKSNCYVYHSCDQDKIRARFLVVSESDRGKQISSYSTRHHIYTVE